MIDTVTINNNIHITQVNYSEDIYSLENKTFNNETIDAKNNEFLKEEYQGPHFYTLDKNLQKSFSNMLAYFGIDETLASVINVLAVEKDQELYLRWLKDLNKLI
jgi:hypothetical protein